MTGDDQITTYLRAVRSCLQVPSAQRRRILEEVESHLHDGTAEYVRAGTPRRQAIDRVIEDLGPPVAVAAAFTNEGPPVPDRAGVVRWLPLLLPLLLLTFAVGLMAWTLTQSFTGGASFTGGWSLGTRTALLINLRIGAFASLLSWTTYLAISRDRDRAWRWAAWACAGTALASPVFLW